MPDMIEFHLSDPDLPEEALKDCFRPPQVSTLVHCIHCDEEYDSWRIVYRVRMDPDGKVRGFWKCGIPGCDGAGFQFDIFPIDPNYIAEDGQVQGEWMDCDEHDEDCQCEECKEFLAEMEQWEKDHPMPEPDPKSLPPQPKLSEAEIEAQTDRRRITDAFNAMGEQTAIPLDDLLPSDDDESEGALTHDTMMQIEEKLGLRVHSPANSASSTAPPKRSQLKPLPLPANWRELLAKQDEERSSGRHPNGEDDIPF